MVRALTFLLLLLGCTDHSASQTLLPHWPQVDGIVLDVLPDTLNNVLYIGGNFTHIGPAQPFGAEVDLVHGQPYAGQPILNGAVHAAVPDGSGGWFIAGEFTGVGGSARSRLARINANGTVHAWNPNVNNTIYSMAISGNSIYIGGTFTTVGGQPRSRVACIDASTGGVSAWDPGASTTVRTVLAQDDMVYVGGDFTTIGGEARNRIARIDATGEVTSWDPNANGSVRSIAVDGPTVYLGGFFDLLGGEARAHLAAVDSGTAAISSWDPAPTNNVFALAVNEGTVYAGGSFMNIGGMQRNNLAAIDAVSGLITPWDPNVDVTVRTLSIEGAKVYAGGDFTHVGGVFRKHVAAIDIASGLVTAWEAVANGEVHTVVESAGDVYVGGTFDGIGGRDRANAAALDLLTGEILDWNPSTDLGIATLALGTNGVYLGGGFTTVQGQSRHYIAMVDPVSGEPTAFEIWFDGVVKDLACSGDTLYVAGGFVNVGGGSSAGLAELDATTAAWLGWSPTVLGNIMDMHIEGDLLYLSGSFFQISTVERRCLAAIQRSTHQITPWNPNVNSAGWPEVRAMGFVGDVVHIGGIFNSIGDSLRFCLGAVDKATGLATSWDPVCNCYMDGFSEIDGQLYMSGSITSFAGQTRGGMAILDAAGNLDPWDPEFDGAVRAFDLFHSMMFAVGDFDHSGNVIRKKLAVFSKTELTVAPVMGSLCAGGTGSVSFATAENYHPGNVFTVEMSDPTGSFYQPVVVGSSLAVVGGSIDVLIPLGTPTGANYRFRIVSSAPKQYSNITAMAASVTAPVAWYFDGDDDGFGDVLLDSLACDQPIGYVADSTDCDDGDNLVFVNATCDDLDPGTTNDSIGPDCVCSGELVTGIQVGYDESFHIWPVPAGDILNLSKTRDGALFDIMGRRVMTFSQMRIINLGALLEGVYLLRTTTGETQHFYHEQ